MLRVTEVAPNNSFKPILDSDISALPLRLLTTTVDA